MALNGVTYDWKSDIELADIKAKKNNGRKDAEIDPFNFPSGTQIGVIAQDVEQVLPELVLTDGDGLKSVDYVKIIPVLIEAMKEQQKQLDEQNAKIQQLMLELEKLKAK